ncbi:hypothetical protein AKJ51_02900 [candidate division MSBL1 archaeon SCGC-AAA382A20]|uniref:MEMO1 family protein AKJ51_02900 n=1 Tax=candidate division MSBL1 archaeon SCGC-AAA382A20 TaxID=1698280 RepID=A0A133VK31_9EURY|nr:hypothetical protein AKJ51_02900 [candidate division MSBL1 archaeon SCGC-AAA382A20]
MQGWRNPTVADRFYAGNESDLRSQIEKCFTHAHGPGRVPEVKEGPRELIGLVSPHAGYPYSGPVAAHGFSKLAEDGKPESVVLIGPNHSATGSDVALDSSDGWKTPLGRVPIDVDLRDEILANVEIADLDSSAHSREHSLEVQLPFAQYLFGDDFQIVPICMRRQDLTVCKALGKGIGETISRDVLIVASTDLTHYEPQKDAEEKDKEVIEKMEALDGEGLVNLVTERNFSVCGYGPVSSTIFAARSLVVERGELFKYATSGDIAGPSARGVVGYCSYGFFR